MGLRGVRRRQGKAGETGREADEAKGLGSLTDGSGI